ncbi:hypothetical protein D3C77_813250 [compost metagenome]
MPVAPAPLAAMLPLCVSVTFPPDPVLPAPAVLPAKPPAALPPSPPPPPMDWAITPKA